MARSPYPHFTPPEVPPLIQLIVAATLHANESPIASVPNHPASGLLILCGYTLIKRRRVVAHATCMIAAVLCSAAFLSCYITYHTLKAMHGEAERRRP